MLSIKELKYGNREAQRKLYELHKVAMFKLCRMYVKDRGEAEDLLHDGFIRVFNNIDKYDEDKGHIAGWMRRVFTNTCLMHLRKNKLIFSELEINSAISTLSESIDCEELNLLSMGQIFKLLHLLPEGYKAVFILFFIEGFRHNEISTFLGISESTSKSQLLKAKKKMRELIKSHFPSHYSKYAMNLQS